MSYRLDLLDATGKAVPAETHDVIEATNVGVCIVEGPAETWIPWTAISRATITNLTGEVRRPDRVVGRRPQQRRRAAR